MTVYVSSATFCICVHGFAVTDNACVVSVCVMAHNDNTLMDVLF